MPQPEIRVRLSGVPAWHRADPGNPGQGPLARKDAALLALLALEAPVARERVLALLWPEVDAARAANSLRQRVFRLRRDTGHRLIQHDDMLSLAAGVETDLTQPDLDAGELLAGHDYGDGEELERWVAAARARWNDRRVDALTAQAAHKESAGEWAEALRLTGRAIDLAPLREHGWRRLMRLHYLRGDRSAAVAAFESFELALKEAHGARPSAETLEQLRLIEAMAPSPSGPRRMLPAALVRPPQVVGRAAELRAMHRAWEAGRAFVLLGAAGMGKTRLLTEFLTSVPAVAQAQGRPGDERSPYATAARLLHEVAAACAQWPADAPRGELARLLPELGTPAAGPAQQAMLWRAVERLLHAAHRQGLAAVAVDDLQFADDASVELFRWLTASEALARLHFAFATRPQEGPQARTQLQDWWADSGRPEAVPLAPLAAEDVAQLLHLLALPEAPESLAPALVRHAGGQPFYLLETLKDLVLQGADDTGLPRPATVRTLIERRLQALPDTARDLMRLAAVAGGDLSAEHASAILGQGPLALVGPWSALQEAGVMQGQAFTHELMREAALAQVPAPVRQWLHGQLAQLLEQDVRVPAGRVAEHWLAAGRQDAAGRSLLKAGEAAYRAGRLPECMALLERAAAASAEAGDLDTRFDALRQRLDAVLIRESGEAALQAAAELAPLARTPLQAAELLRLELEALLNLERFTDVLQRGPGLLQPQILPPMMVASGLSLIAFAQAALGQHAAAAESADQALVQARLLRHEPGGAELLGHVMSLRANSCHVLGRLAEALAAATEGAQLALERGDLADFAINTTNMATFHALSGDSPAALVCALRAHEAFVAAGAGTGQMAAINRITVGAAAHQAGQKALALEHLQAALEALGPQAPLAGRVKVRTVLAGLLLDEGQAAAAAALYDDAGIDECELSPVWRALWRLGRARAFEAVGRAEDALWPEALQAAACAAEQDALMAIQAAWIERLPLDDALQALDRADAFAQSQGRAGVQRAVRCLRLQRLWRDPAARGLRNAEIQALLQAVKADLEAPLHTAVTRAAARAVVADVESGGG